MNFLRPTDYVRMTNIPADKKGMKVLMSVGTGLGCCITMGDTVYPSEYGQTLFPDGSALERFVSGQGIKENYAKQTGKKLSAYKIEEHMKRGQKTADKAYQSFYSALAFAAQNLALITQPHGGLYLTGGMLSVVDMRKTRTIQQIQSHPKMASLLKTIPVYVITNRNLAFVGLSKLARKYGWT